MTDNVIIFGWVCVVFFGLTVVIPYLRGKSDLLTTWNLFLIGAMNFVGYAAVQSGWDVYSYGLFTNDDYIKLMLGTTVFFVALYIAYYRTRWAGRLAGRTLLRWPEYRGGALLPILVICVAIELVGLLTPNVQFLGQIVIIIGPTAGVIAVAVCFRAWLNNKTSGVLLFVTLGLLALAAVSSINNSTGRRSLLSVLVVMPFCAYWMWFRFRPKLYTVVPLVLAVLMTVVMMAGYTTIRHRYNSEKVNVADRTAFETTIESLTLLPTAVMELSTLAEVFGGDSMEASLVAIQYYSTVAHPQPFFSSKYILANPFPRAWWPDTWGEKPKALGETLPRDIGVWTRTGYVNWGPGIAGHGFHEGGYHMLAFYGILIGLSLRYMDELLVRQSDNPYYLGVIAAASSQIIAFSRGDMALFAVLILGAILAGFIIRWVGRIFTGYGLVYPSDAERAALAAIESQPAPQIDRPEWSGARGSFAAMQN